MIKHILGLFTSKKDTKISRYSSAGDFLRNASDAEIKNMLREAAQKANEDQLRVFNKAQSMR